MIRIGDFARLGQVSVATLRHYDEIGLLKPVAIDGDTAYRYYEVAQLARLNRILALKDLGFTLEQVGAVLEGISPDELRGMLKLGQAKAEQNLAVEQARLLRIASRIRQLELERVMPAYDVVTKEVEPILVASRRVIIPFNNQVAEILGAAFDETYAYIRSTGAQESGPCIALWRQPASVLENEDAEAAVPIDRAIAGSERVPVHELPGGLVASAICEGSFEQFPLIHATLLSWIESNGYQSPGPIREVYLQEGGDGKTAVTEIQYPLEKAPNR